MELERQSRRTQSGKSYNEELQEVTFFMVIPGVPIPLARPRFGQGRTYTNDDQKSAMESIQWSMIAEMRRQGLNTVSGKPLRVSLEFVFQSVEKKHGPKQTRGDLDNYIKFVLDCGNKHIWEDDGLIYHIVASKHWGARSETVLKVSWWMESKKSQLS